MPRFAIEYFVLGLRRRVQTDSTELRLPIDNDYRRLALQILQSQAWKSMPANSGSERKRAIGRPMNRAFSGG